VLAGGGTAPRILNLVKLTSHPHVGD